MAKITAPVKGFTGKVVGVMFDGGVAETDDERQLAYFRRHGYTVEETDTKPEGPKYPAGQDPAEGWTVAQLTAWAGDNGVEVPAGPKPAVVEAVLTALAERKVKAEADAKAAAANTPPQS